MCTYSSIGVSSMTNYLNTRENLWNYPPPSLPNNKSHHVVMAAAAEKAAVAAAARRACKTAPNYQPFDDYLGLSGMLQTLNVSEPINMAPGGHRARLGSDGAEMFDDFRANGVDAELDDFDRIIHKLRSEDGSPPPSNQSSSSISPASASPPTSSTMSALNQNLAMLEILREKERRAIAAQQQQQLLAASAMLPPLPPVTPASSRAPTLPPSSSRRSRHGSGGSGGSSGQTVCVFCRNNGEPVHVYTAHYLKDATGRVTCPILRAYKCPYCRASGDNAHTKTYCPLAISALGEAPLSAERVLAKQTTRSSCGKKRSRALTGGALGCSSGMFPTSTSPPLHLLNGLHAFD